MNERGYITVDEDFGVGWSTDLDYLYSDYNVETGYYETLVVYSDCFGAVTYEWDYDIVRWVRYLTEPMEDLVGLPYRKTILNGENNNMNTPFHFNHFSIRAYDAFEDQKSLLREKFNMIPWAGPETPEEMIEAIKAGDYEIKESDPTKTRCYGSTPRYLKDLKWVRKSKPKDEEGYDKALSKLTSAYREFMDLLHVETDAKEVKKAFDKFAATVS